MKLYKIVTVALLGVALGITGADIALAVHHHQAPPVQAQPWPRGAAV